MPDPHPDVMTAADALDLEARLTRQLAHLEARVARLETPAPPPQCAAWRDLRFVLGVLLGASVLWGVLRVWCW